MQNEADLKTYELVNEWLKKYYEAKSNYKKMKFKSLIVTRMLPIIKKIARTIARRSYDPIDDLVQAGSIGLLKAIDNFSTQVNDNFRIYAGCRIIGEMKHYLRDRLDTIRVPRHIQELAFRINSFTSTLTHEELQAITSDEVASALSVDTKDVDFIMQVDRRKSTISLDGLYNFDNSSMNYEEFLMVDDSYKELRELEDAKIVFKDIIEKLPDEYKKLVKMYYYEDMMQKEISEKLNLTQMQVSRKLRKAFGLLYKMIADKNTGV